MSWINTFLHQGDEVLYTADGIRWSNTPDGEIYGEPLNAQEAESINHTADLSLTYPYDRKGAPRQSTVTIGPNSLEVHKPVQEGDTTIKFRYNGDAPKPVTQET